MGHPTQTATPGGQRLRALRRATGKTQLTVELEASLGLGYLQRLEQGKVRQPQAATLQRLLDALEVPYPERRTVLALFGYAAPTSAPTLAEARRAAAVFAAEVRQDSLPVYLLDCAHRLWAWNGLVPKVFEAVGDGAASLDREPVSMPRLIFDGQAGIAGAVLNPHMFFSAQVRILDYERQHWGEAAGQSDFVEEMRQYPLFDAYWDKQVRDGGALVPMRPVADLQLKRGKGRLQFRLISEPLAEDGRFRVIYYLPTDMETVRQCLEWQAGQG